MLRPGGDGDDDGDGDGDAGDGREAGVQSIRGSARATAALVVAAPPPPRAAASTSATASRSARRRRKNAAAIPLRGGRHGPRPEHVGRQDVQRRQRARRQSARAELAAASREGEQEALRLRSQRRPADHRHRHRIVARNVCQRRAARSRPAGALGERRRVARPHLQAPADHPAARDAREARRRLRRHRAHPGARPAAAPVPGARLPGPGQEAVFRHQRRGALCSRCNARRLAQPSPTDDGASAAPPSPPEAATEAGAHRRAPGVDGGAVAGIRERKLPPGGRGSDYGECNGTAARAGIAW